MDEKTVILSKKLYEIHDDVREIKKGLAHLIGAIACQESETPNSQNKETVRRLLENLGFEVVDRATKDSE